jgi:hypothetical protein
LLCTLPAALHAMWLFVCQRFRSLQSDLHYVTPVCSPPPAPLPSQEFTQTESVTQFGFQFLAPPPIQQNIAIRGTHGQLCLLARWYRCTIMALCETYS